MSVYKYGKNIPEFVKRFREERDLTQRDLSKMMKIHSQYVSNVERGVNENPIEFCARLMPFVEKDRAIYLLGLMEESSHQRVYARLNIKRKRKTAQVSA